MRKFITVFIVGLSLLGSAMPAMADWHGERNRGWHDHGHYDRHYDHRWERRERIVYRPVPVARYWPGYYYDPFYYSYPYSSSFSFIFR
jgi:hypothetical protein